MTLAEAMQQLEANGSEQYRKTYLRHGASEPMFGVSFAILGKLQKQIKTDHALAQALWVTGNHDAQVLATLIGDPEAMTAKEAELWAKGFTNYCQMEMCARFLGKGKLAKPLAEKWHKAKGEWVASAGWLLLALLAMNDHELPDDYFMPYLTLIEKGIHQQPNRVRHEMNSALIGIGMRNPALRERAVAVAHTIGKVVVDHGQTNCKTPDAIAYINKALAHVSKAKKK